MASVALANGLNANLVRTWVGKAEQDGAKPTLDADPESPKVAEGTQVAGASFVAVRLDQSAAKPDIRIELNRKGTTVTVTWPVGDATECAVWLREVLR
jgi:transposase